MLGLALALASPAQAATLDVCASCAHTSVGSAVAAASSGDTIRVAAGNYVESGLTIRVDLTIEGAGSATTRLQSASAQVIAVPSGTVSISGLELDNTAGGRGILAERGTLALDDIVVEDESGTYDGMGVYASASTNLTITDSWFQNLTTTGSGAAVYTGGNVTSARNAYSGNASDADGGAIWACG